MSRSKWWTLLLVSNVGWDESVLSRCGSELMVYHEYGYVLFVTLVPVPADTGPPLGWQQHPAATTTTTKPTMPPVDEVTAAKAAAMKFFDAIAKGDAKTAAQVSIAEPAELRWIDAAAATGKAQGELLAAATKRFGKAQSTRYFRKPGEHTAKLLSAASVEVKGNHAVVILDADILLIPHRKLEMSRTDEGWRMNWTATFQSARQAEGIAGMLNFLAEQDRAVARKIDAGQYKTAEEAELDHERAVKTGMLRMMFGGPTTKPG